MFLQHFGYPLDNFIGIDANFLCTGHNYTTKCKKKLLSICKFNMDGHWTLKLLKENKRAVRRSRKSRWNPASCLFRQPSLPEEEFPVSPPAQWTSVVSQFRRKPRILNCKNCSRDTNRRGKRWPGSTNKSWVPFTPGVNNRLRQPQQQTNQNSPTIQRQETTKSVWTPSPGARASPGHGEGCGVPIPNSTPGGGNGGPYVANSTSSSSPGTPTRKPKTFPDASRR